MATSWSITKYRDPEKLDISVLGKALQYKQTEYDTNVGQTQQLINQYAGTDLLRDVDKQYFGERLNTLVSYINESGSRDWSKKSVGRDIQSYVSTALDRNVLSAINSTQVYRKQQAEIEDIKKNKPDQYSMQNEWFATQDLQRYLNSGQVGDGYRAQSYVPYTDVNKTILENTKYLKEFGVEYYTSSEGNAYFRKINNHEKIDPTVAKEYLKGMMDSKMMNQLYIDGQYQFKDLDEQSVKAQYDSKINSYVNYNSDKINELKTLSVSATKEKKAEYQAQIATLENSTNEFNKSKLTKLGKNSMASYLHNNSFMDKWTNFLSYDRVKDWEIDDSGFQMHKLDVDIAENNRNYELKSAEFTYGMKKDQAEMALKREEIELKGKSSGMTRDATGKWVIDPTNPANGMTTSEAGGELKEETTPELFKTKQAELNNNSKILEQNVAGEIEKMLADPANAELAKQLGTSNPKYIAYKLVNSPSKHKVIYNMLSTENKRIVDATISSKAALDDVDKNLNPIRNDMRKFGDAMLSNKTKPDLKQNFVKAIGGLTLDAKGNVVKGNVLEGNNPMAVAARTIAAINFRMMSGNLSDDETAQYRRMIGLELANTSMTPKQRGEAFSKLTYRKNYSGFWDGLGQWAASAASSAGLGTVLTAAQEGINAMSGSSDKSTFATDFIRYGNKANTKGNSEGIIDQIDRKLLPFTQNKNTSSIGGASIWGDADIDVERLGFDPSNMEQRWKGQTDAVRQKLLADKTTTFNKSLNIDLGSKFGKTVSGSLKSYLHVGSEIQKDGVAKIIMDQKTGMANVTIAVKDGKTYKPTTVQVKIADLPQSITSSVKQEQTNMLYSASNPYAVRYESETEIPDNKQDWSKKVALMPESQRTELFNNPPMTKEDIITNLSTVYGKEIVQQNSKEISQLIDKPISISMVPEGGQWTLVANQEGANIMRRPTGKDSYDPQLMEKYSTELVTNIILENIKQTISRK